FLSHRQMRAVFHGDKVLVRIRGRDRRGRDEGEVVEVLERGTKELVGRVYFENQVPLLESLNRRIGHEILIEKYEAKPEDGQIVVARVLQQPSLHGLATVEVVETLGEHLTPDMEVEVALRNNDIPYNFPDEALIEADGLPIEVKPQQKRHRVDLRSLDLVTIDGEDARDFDDAVYSESRPGGGFRLIVAIADVASYVKPGSALDHEAYQRGTSVYFPQYVVPMLPEKLSNGLCSLKPEVDRLAMVCDMTISAQGRIGSYQFYEGVMRSSERLTYTQVGEWINAGSFPRHSDSLDSLLKLAQLLSKTRQARGALDFDTTEVRFEFEESGRVVNVEPATRNFAHRLIEECMLCANICTARLIDRSGLPGLYRVHEKPEQEKIEYLRQFLSAFGVDIGEGEPADYQRAVEALRQQKNGHVLQVALLRSLQQAVYQPENRGHFGLAYSHYAHFTSPIRRYPDLLTHRLIKSLIHRREPPKEVKQLGKPRKNSDYLYDAEAIATFGEHLSFAERRADDAVYEVLQWVKCDFISEHVGDDFEGIVSSVTKFGFFVELEGVFVEGLVHVSTLAGDYFHFEAGDQCLVGERTGAAFGLGDIVTVQVAGVDVDERKIDLELLTHSPLTSRRRTKKKPVKQSKKRAPKRRRRKR
ncbi:MAG: ribonuclease R, partial [Gammaproteobacteria bacterium]|nr:ribonuclease R [Gammaproteobacteria bacterium]